jgi:hypothetical protein
VCAQSSVKPCLRPRTSLRARRRANATANRSMSLRGSSSLGA